MELVKPKLAEQGIDLELVKQSDNVLTMRQTDTGEFDAAHIAHWPGLKASAEEMGLTPVPTCSGKGLAPNLGTSSV